MSVVAVIVIAVVKGVILLCRSLRSFHWSILSFHSKSIAFYCIMHHSIEYGDAYDSDIMDGSGNEGQCDL